MVFYDNLGRAIQTLTDNHLDTSPDRTSSLLDFTGRTLETKQNLRTLQIQTRQSYEIGGRPKATCQQITTPTNVGTANWEPINRNIYNDLGELSTKTLGCNLQTIDYTYNIKGWLNNINNPATLVADKDLFGMSLAYDAIGNITTWNYQNASPQLGTGNGIVPPLGARGLYAYNFSYDNLNRLQNSSLSKTGVAMFGNTQSYDANGNVLALQRTFNGSIVDNMAYTYQGINKLGSITDNGTNPTTGEFFKDGTANYTYDANGNLKTDTGKNISNISYNYMNLVSAVTQNNKQSTYTYASNGQKLSADFGAGKKYDYIGNAVYVNDTLEFIGTAEGRYTKKGYEYYLKDHLGNLRTSFTCENGTLKVNQENHYDPWGLNLPIGVEGKDRFTYNSKEKQDGTGWLDYGARMYDPQKVVWNGIDPLAEDEDQYPLSPYAYCFNNPINFIDPDGMKGEEPEGKKLCPECKQLDEVQVKGQRITNYLIPFIPLGQDIGFGSQQRLFNYIPHERQLASQVLDGSILPSNYARNRYLMQRDLRQAFLSRRAYFSYMLSQLSKPLSAQKLTAISKFNPATWGGMMSKLSGSGTRLSTTVMAGAGLLGKMVLPASIAMDVSRLNNGEISGSKFGANTSIGLYSAFGGPPGWILGGVSTVVDATIGWDNAIKASGEYYQREREMFPLGSGIPTKIY